MSFLCSMARNSLRDKLRSSAIQEGFGKESLFLQVEETHLFWIFPWSLPQEVLQARRSKGLGLGYCQGVAQNVIEGQKPLGLPWNASGFP